jgi:hypothetical protein
MSVADAGHLTDFQAKQLAVRALRQARAAYRKADTQGEKFEREVDRLIKRKTRINAGSFNTLTKHYQEYIRLVSQMQVPLTDAFDVASSF